MSLILKFIRSTKFMVSSLLNLVHNFAEAIHKIKAKHGSDSKNCKKFGFK